MFIDIHVLEVHPIDFKEDLPPETIELGPDMRQSTDLKFSGRAELIEEHGTRRGETIQDIRIVAEFETQIEALCARCLEPVTHEVSRKFDLFYRPIATVSEGSDEISITQAEADIGFYRGDGLLLEDVLREQVLLAVPAKTLCSEDCKGLCPHCGRNLNQGTCDCREERTDPRWDALKQVRDKLQQS
jgi:DUF177 domain-containing protein